MQEAVVWKEGLFIRPQHFQQSDRYYNYELMTRTKELGINNWGFFNLELDTNLLDSGYIAIEKAYGVMPDGTLFNLNSKSHPLSISISNADSGKSIYLCLPLTIANADSVTFEEKSKQVTRFTARTIDELANSNFGEESVTQMLLARQNFKLLFEDELNDGYISIKLVEVGAVSNSGAVTLQEYVPTYLHMHTADKLQLQIEDLSNIIVYRIEKVAEKVSDANLQATELGDYLLLQLLNRFSGRLHYFLTQDRIHPGELYLELVSLASELAVFMKKEKRLTQAFTYDHKEQYACYATLIKDLKDMLSNVLEQNSINMLIEQRKYGISVAKIEDKSLIEEGVFVLSVTADVEPDQLKKILLANFKVGSVETIRELVNFHLAGFELKPLAAAPRQVPFRANHSYFKVEIRSEEKVKLINSGGFAFHLSKEVPGFAFNLWAMRKDA